MSADPRTTLVLLASEQLWPNLHSIEHWTPELRRVLLYHTPDRRSAEPAQRLVRFCRERCGWDEERDKDRVLPNKGPATAEGVIERFNAWRKEFSDGPWVVNATGGTKLMFDGAASFRGRDGVLVVYRELSPGSPWFKLGHEQDGTPTASHIEISADETDSI